MQTLSPLASLNPDDVTSTEVREDGRVVLQAGLIGTLYFADGHSDEARRQLSACVDDFLQIAAPHLRWAADSRYKAWREFPVSPPSEWLPSLDPGKGWEAQYHAGEQAEDASAWQLEILAMHAWQSRRGDLSYVHFALPISWVNPQFIELMRRWCERLRPVHGYAGAGLVESMDEHRRRHYVDLVYRAATRFPGLQVDYPVFHADHLKQGIKSVDWITVLGTELVEKAGGLGALRSKLDLKEFGMFEIGAGGVIIQAGERPELGDAEKGVRPRLYLELNRALRALRAEYKAGFQSGQFRQPFLDAQATQRWLARFD